jgi:type II secretory pathway pseudopilin PulG
MKKYFIHVNGSSVGPYSYEDLRTMRIQKTTPVWYDGLGNWKNAGDVSELRGLFASNASTFTTSQNYSKPGSRSTYNFTNDNLSGNIGSEKTGKNTAAIVVVVVVMLFIGAGIFIYYQQQRKKAMAEELMNQLVEEYQTQEGEANEIIEEAIAEPPVAVEEAMDYGTSEFSGRFNNYSGGILKISGSDENHLTVSIKLDESYGCRGEISGEAKKIEDNKLQMRTSSGCKLTIKYSTGFVMIEESAACSSDHGSACTFEGIYSKEH